MPVVTADPKERCYRVRVREHFVAACRDRGYEVRDSLRYKRGLQAWLGGSLVGEYSPSRPSAWYYKDALVRVQIKNLNQHAGTVQATWLGRASSGRWNNEAEIYNLTEGSDAYLLKAVMCAWGKRGVPVVDSFEISVSELAELGDGWWGHPG
jgi:hypothetical protein